MTVDILIPDLGKGVTYCTIVRWLCHEGENVRRGQILLEIMTDKASVDVESPASGTLSRILAAADEDVRVGTAVGRINGD